MTAQIERPRGWAALRAASSPRPTPARVVAAILLGLLGFAVAVQFRTTQAQGLDALRQSDLVRILDDTTTRADRLRAESEELERTREQLASGTDQSRAAIEEAHKRAEVLGILAGTVPAQGPGIVMTVADTGGKVQPDALLDAVEELRDAGAEAIQIGGVRVVASTYFTDAVGEGHGVVVDGVGVKPPYRIVAIGDPQTMAAALEIPGGVSESFRQAGVEPSIAQRDQVEVLALRAPAKPQYARPAATSGG
jgi:uncharacterized protein YlxW (UPF0749 family)